ncbi:MAG: RNA polymerase sigma factor [Myxococcaceae bacterium]
MANLPAVWALLRNPFVSAARLDDRTLLLRARDGDADAFRHVFDRHAPNVHRFLADLLGDSPAADEATQETFVRAYQKLHALKDEERLASWLYGIARHITLEHRRNRLRHPESSLDAAHEDAPEALHTGDNPESLLLSRESGELLNGALQKLPEDRRTVLLLRADHGLSYADIASLMDWSLAKTKVEIHRARGQLRTFLEEEAP